jgi:Protein of unknown function (DUF3800)
MQVCYVDEAGDARTLPTATSQIAPVCVLAGVVFDQASLQNLTQEYITLKRATHPNLPIRTAVHRLAWVLAEIKGADLRRAMRSDAPRRNRRHAIYFLDKFMTLLEDYEAKIIGRVWVKEIAGPCNEAAIFGYSMQAICSYFQHYLADLDQMGFVVADSRGPSGDASISHSIFTQKFKLQGDEYDRVLEMPMFGHSLNHVGLQIADLLASALLFPMATYRYCRDHVESVHVDEGFGRLTARYGARLSALQFRYADADGRWRGGIAVDDRIGHLHGGYMFRVD